MKKLFLFFSVFILFISLYSKETELFFPVQWKDRSSFPCINENLTITDPIFGCQKVEAGLAAGLSSAELYAKVKVTVIWDEDSVIQGDTLTLRIITEPLNDNKPTIYSNYGFSIGLGASIQAFGPLGGPWISGPGIGLDFNVNINSDENPPMGPDDTEKAKGDDVVDFLSLIPEQKAAAKGLGSPIINQYGDTLLYNYKGEGNSSSDALGLFDFASLKLSGGLKINDGNIKLNIGCGNSYFTGSNFQFSWFERTDTLYYKIFIDSFAPESAVDYIYIKNPIYSISLWNRMGMQLQTLGITLASSYWIDEDKYDFKGTRWLVPHPLTPTADLIRPIPITITGSPLYRPDYQSTWIFAIPYNYWNDFSDDFPQASCTTDFRFMVYNGGSSVVPEGSLRFTTGEDTVYFEIDSLNVYDAQEFSYKYVFDEAGEYFVTMDANYNHMWEEYSYANNRYTGMYKVKEPQKRLYIGIRKDSVNLLQPDSILRITVQMNENVDDISLDYSGNFYRTIVPGNDTILISVLPDTANTDYYITSHNEITTGHSIANDTIYIELDKFAVFYGRVNDNLMIPMDSVSVMLGSLSDTTDASGNFSFNRLIPLSDTFKYSLSIRSPKYYEYDTSIHLGSGDSLSMSFTMISPDSTAPIGSIDIIGGFEMHSLYKCSTGEIIIKLSANDDYSGLKFAEIMNESGIWDTFDFDSPGDDSIMYITWNLPSDISNGFKKIFCRFTDMANNTSLSITDSVYLIAEGPTGTFTVIDSVTNSESVRVQLNAMDPFLNVEKAIISVSGGGSYTFNMTSEPVSVQIPSSDGTYIISCQYVNSMNISGTLYTDNCIHNYQGYVLIDWGKEFSKDNDVILSFDGSIIGVNNVDLTGGLGLGTYPYLQTFVPHCSEIAAISVYLNSVTKNSHICLYSDSSDGFSNHMPGHYLGSYDVSSGSAGWCYGILAVPVSVNPTDTYNIVIFTDSITEVNSSFSIESCDPSNYSEGNLYGSPAKKGLMWFDMSCDMAFKIYGKPDSIEISDSADMSSSQIISYRTTYPWILDNTYGHAYVFSRYKYGGIWNDIINDGIIIDTSAPSISNIDINRGRLFTETPACTVSVAYSDDFSQECSLFVNSESYFVSRNQSFIYYFEDSITETKTLNIQAKDMAGNISGIHQASIDYDSLGIEFYPNFNNSSSIYISSRYPTLYFNTSKSINPDSIRFFESFINNKWKPYSSSVACTLNSNPYMHIMVVDVMDNYGKSRRNVIPAIIDSTPPLQLKRAFISDNGVDGNVRVSWTGVNEDIESGLKNIHCYLRNVDDTSVITQAIITEPNVSDTIVYGFDLYNSYYFSISARNNAGLFGDYIYSPVFTVNSNPYNPTILYPKNDSVSVLPVFSITASDYQTDTTLCYKIEIADDNTFSNIIRVFDGKSVMDNWSHDRYASGDTAEYYVQSDDSLYIGNMYYWRAYVYDSVSSGIVSNTDSFYVNTVSGIKPDYYKNIDKLKYTFRNKGVYSGDIDFNIEIPASANICSAVYDIKGAFVKTLITGVLRRGGYNITWNQKNAFNEQISAGTYFIITTIDNKKYKEKVVLIR